MPAKNLRLLRLKKKEDMLRRKQSQRELRKLMSIRGYWTKEVNRRHQEMFETPVWKYETDNLKRYKIKNEGFKNVQTFLRHNRLRSLDLLEVNTKIIYTLHLTLEKWEDRKLITRDFYIHKPPYIVTTYGDIKKSFSGLINFFNSKIAELRTRGSGWWVKSIDVLEIKTVPYTHEKGGNIDFDKLPKKLQNRKVFPVIPSENNECLKDAVYKILGEDADLNWGDIEFPADKKDLQTFEKLNPDYLVFCFGYLTDFYIHYSHKDFRELENEKKVIYLLLYSNHYFPITNLKAFNKILYGSKDLYFNCKTCLSNFSSQEKLDDHYTYCKKDFQTRVDMPKEDSVLKFKNERYSEYNPYICYIDSEANLEKIEEKEKYQKHNASCFGLLFVNSLKKTSEYFHLYNSDDLIEKLIEISQKCYGGEGVKMSWEERLKGEKKLGKTKQCENCKCDFTEENKAVIDHCHFTGKFRRILCNSCNLKLKTPKILPVIGHNLMKYDEKLIIRSLKKKANIIAKNMENFISFSLTLDGVRFLDSYKFFNSSLDTLVKNLLSKGKDKFVHTKQHFPKTKEFNLCLKKGVYPYSYITSDSVLDETSLPPREAFYNNLTGKHIKEEEYQHALKVWKVFGCKTLRDYQKIYQKLDCTQLADIFESFRETIYPIYNLDPTHYITIPSFAFDCALKFTKQELELISDPTMYNFIEGGIRGGVSMATTRYAESNNKYQNDYDPNKESSFLNYFDATNLYGKAQSLSLPVSDFKWGFPDEWESYGDCIVDVDISLPEDLWEHFSDYPLCTEHEDDRLMCSFKPKKNYICHSSYLRDVLKRGYKLDRVNKVLTFKSKPWLKSYIEKNTLLRSQSRDDFEKDLWKLMNNSVYGKQIEDVRKRINIVHATQRNIRREYRKQTFKNVTDLSKDVFLVEHLKEKVVLNKPIYGGLAILDYSKIIMNQFFYDYLKPKYGDNVRLVYTDTDSFIIQVYTEDIYKDISPDVLDWFDTSNVPIDFQCLDGSSFPSGKNKKRTGYFKDELGGEQMKRIVALSSKMYCYEKENGKCEKRCKGVTSKILDNVVFDHYVKALTGEIYYDEMDIIRSHNHTLYTEKMVKKVLDPYDKKRQILEDGITTLPWC